MNEFSFFVNDNAHKNVSGSLKYFFNGDKPVILCIGTDAAIGDSLGPIIGTMLKKANIDAFVYGTLSSAITAKEVAKIKGLIKATHTNSKLLVIDAAIGDSADVGKIKITPNSIKPGLGANKNLPPIGDVTIMGIVAEKSRSNYAFLNLTRLSPIYSMAEKIAEGVIEYFGTLDKTKYISN